MEGSVEPPTGDPITNPIAIVTENINPTISVAGPSNHTRNTTDRQTSSALLQNDLVRINMGQMLQLKEIGYQAAGPVNGPNEGFPEYEVRKEVLQVLNTQSQNTPNPTPKDPEVAIGEMDPDPVTIGDSNADWVPIRIDPSLLGHTEQVNEPDAAELAPNAGSNIRPTTPSDKNPGSAINPNPTTPKPKLGKRAQVNVSPQEIHQTRGNKKKKKVTDDDLAAMEAQNMVQSGSRRRIKRGRKG
jgi:hypothetical protein